MLNPRTLFSLLVGAAALSACGDKGDDSGAEGGPSEPATWEEVRDDVLAPSCGFSSCHTPPGSAQFGVDNETAEDEWVNVESVNKPGAILVVPGDADASYLIQKMEGADGISDDPMPPPAGGLDAAKIERVRSWIDNMQ